MPTLTPNGATLHYDVTGSGPETLVFLHGLMLTSPSWHYQVERFRATHRVITFDLRGQGLSDKPRDGLDLDTLAEDAAGLIRHLAPEGAHVVGFSMGAFIALRLAARHPALVRSLCLIGASAKAEDPANLPRYAVLIALVRLFGARVAVRPMMKILFGKTFLANPALAAVLAGWRGALRALPRSVARAAAASAARGRIEGELPQISAPVLVISGSEDHPVPPAQAREVAEAIPGAEFLAVPGAGHAVMLEQPEVVNAALARLLAQGPARGQ